MLTNVQDAVCVQMLVQANQTKGTEDTSTKAYNAKKDNKKSC